ncbi:hypothetical protein OF829_16880 [Sphingomonas sp. LB-2]|uniref:hypothetical protein n=1 Tax=Sphingomonas caeni TaxID=2984949 RepID=UPI00223135BD|nr:hypothetical protein [Sphingomonas caeni]MCW3848914.1 hypothetical protein [Sphingomonas caeni]
MSVSRIMFMLAMAAGLVSAAPASAQFFMKPADLRGERVTGTEPGITGPALPDATPAELRAALTWNLRAALNVAALQCQFEPTLLTLGNYNAILRDHQTELRAAYATLEKYFIRMAKNNRKVGQTELDRYGTRVYSGFSTVSAQLTFCTAAGSIGHAAVFAKPGTLGDVAENRMRELRNSLVPWGEQRWPGTQIRPIQAQQPMPPFANEMCWKKDVYQVKKCGPFKIPPEL